MSLTLFYTILCSFVSGLLFWATLYIMQRNFESRRTVPHIFVEKLVSVLYIYIYN